MSNVEGLARSLYDATGDVRDMNQMVIPREILRDFDASHQRLVEALKEAIDDLKWYRDRCHILLSHDELEEKINAALESAQALSN